MNDFLFELNNIRFEISFKSFDELRLILSFCQKNNIYRLNIPCKNSLKKDFLLNSIKISREEYPNIEIIPHFSIFHEFKRNRLNTLKSFDRFYKTVQYLGCSQVLLVSGSQKRLTLDSQSAISFLKENTLLFDSYYSIGVAFNPYLPNFLFEEEIIKLNKKVNSGLVTSIWIQFGTDSALLESRIKIIKRIISQAKNSYSKKSNIMLYGSVLIPSKQFIARFKYRPWKGVYCAQEFLESVELANDLVKKLLKTYKKYKICPLIETDVFRDDKLNSLKMIFNS